MYAAVALWVVSMLVIAGMVIHDPRQRTVTIGSYHKSAQAWWSGESLYNGPAGMNYLPHFAILYSPFHFLPLRVSEVLWRLCAAAALGAGLWQLTRELFAGESECPFLEATVLSLPLSLGALRNGNANAIFGGVTLLAIVALMQDRWWRAMGWMALAIALKPLGIVLLLLSAIYFSPVARRLPATVLALAGFPFLFASAGYVWSQYQEAWKDLRMCAVVTEHRFADLNGLLRTFGAPLPPGASTVTRVVFGALTAALWLWGARRLKGRWRHLWLYALATAYLMLFNPMTEANSYVILAPALAAWAVCLIQRSPQDRRQEATPHPNPLPAPSSRGEGEDLAGGARRVVHPMDCSVYHPELKQKGLGWALALMALSMGLLPNSLRPFFGNNFALFWHPLMTIAFIGALTWFVARGGARLGAAEGL